MKTAGSDIFLKYSLHINDALNKYYGLIFRHLPQTIFGDLTHMKGDAKRGTAFKQFEKLAFSKWGRFTLNANWGIQKRKNKTKQQCQV